MIPSKKIVENYEHIDSFIREVEVEKIVKNFFLSLNSTAGTLWEAENFYSTRRKIESKSKFLPYELGQLYDLFTFT